VRAADRDRFLATLFAPERFRRALCALYAFNVEIAQVRERVREPMAGEIRLQWWRDVFAGAGGGEAAGHPVAAALTATVVRYRLPPQALIELLDARTFDLYGEPFRSLAELDVYAENTSAALIALAARILNDGSDPGASDLLRHAGIAQALAGLLAAFPRHAARQQLYLPFDLLQRYDVRAEDAFAGRPTQELRAALAALRAHARHHLKAAQALASDMPATLAPALLPAALVRPTLDRLDRRDRNPFGVTPLPPWRRQWALWRAARRGNVLG
jgi:phytoene synthase